jgi:hypothetical protein
VRGEVAFVGAGVEVVEEDEEDEEYPSARRGQIKRNAMAHSRKKKVPALIMLLGFSYRFILYSSSNS